jgi:hypothetical protein
MSSFFYRPNHFVSLILMDTKSKVPRSSTSEVSKNITDIYENELNVIKIVYV